MPYIISGLAKPTTFSDAMHQTMLLNIGPNFSGQEYLVNSIKISQPILLHLLMKMWVHYALHAPESGQYWPFVMGFMISYNMENFIGLHPFINCSGFSNRQS
ncbi:MAG: hypothetical protein EBY07_10030 [Actinobacteria bacterium]|nr:hypothetical protein [Actinomycetota bacterium]